MKKYVFALLLSAVLIFSGCGGRSDPDAEETGYETPDNSFYDWNGDYLDSTGGQALLHIEPAAWRMRSYDILIYIPAGEDAFTTWECTARYDAELGGLSYEKCVRRDMDVGSAGGEVISYEDGTGLIIPSEQDADLLYWIDLKEGRGQDLNFERLPEINTEEGE